MKYNRIILIGLLAIIPLFAIQLPTNNPIVSTGAKIELLNADSLVGTTDTDAGLTRAYEGNVSFRQGDVNVSCGKAFHNISANNAELLKNVIITQQDMQLSSPKVFYDGETGLAQSYKHIKIKDKNMILEADKGYYSTQSLKANFYGNVKIDDDTVSIISDSIEYNRRSMFSKAYGNVKVEDDSTIIYADRIEYQRQFRNTKAFGKVVIQSKFNSTYLTADSVENDSPTAYTIAKSNPILFKIDTLKRDSVFLNAVTMINDTLTILSYDTLTIASESMESMRIDGKEYYNFIGKVEINKSGLQAKANRIVYFRDGGVINMYGSPVVWFDSTQIIADTITIFSEKNKLNKILAEGNSIATIRNDTTYLDKINQMMGNQIHIDFKNDTIDLISSLGDAKSLMFLDSEKGSEGAARTFADTIKVYFEAGKPSNFIGLGGIVGEALPDNMISQNPKSYYLPNYRRIEIKPLKRYLLLNKHN